MLVVRACAFVAAMLLLSGGPASGAPVTAIELLQLGPQGSYGVLSSFPGATQASANLAPASGLEATGDVSAFATGGGLGGIVRAFVEDTTTQGSSIGGGFDATVTWSDIVISGPGSTTDLSASAVLGGFLSVLEEPLQALSAGADLFAELRVSGANPLGGTTSEASSLTVSVLPEGATSASLTTPLITIDTSQNVEVRMRLRVRARADSGFPTGSAAAIADFANTMTFVEGQDVFSLDPGFTANSVDAGIVDNRWTPLPEVEPGWLALVGLAALASRRIAAPATELRPS